MERHVEIRPREPQDEHFLRMMEEIEIMAAVLEDVESAEVADRITMWIDYMIYRALYAAEDDVTPECAPEARECRKLVMAHLDSMASGRPVSARRASTS